MTDPSPIPMSRTSQRMNMDVEPRVKRDKSQGYQGEQKFFLQAGMSPRQQPSLLIPNASFFLLVMHRSLLAAGCAGMRQRMASLDASLPACLALH